MDYGRKNVKKRSKKLSNKREKNRRRFGLAFGKTILVIILFSVVATVGLAGMYVKNLVDELPDASTINISPQGFQTVVYDNTGKEIERLASAGANRQYVTLNQIPNDLQKAFIALEDSRFYEHNGIDLKGIVRAGVTYFTSGGKTTQGASTITQQLLKNNYFTGWTTENTRMSSINRKIQEQYLAVELEKITDKDTILENYLNTINLGQNTLGVEAAAERYFNKDVKDLNLSECAVIAAITQNPSRYNPITQPDENANRRKKCLGDMLKQGYITQSEYDEALMDDVYDRINIVNSQMSSNNITTYFVDALTDSVIKDLMEQRGYTETESYTLLYSGGLSIYSTQDPEIQKVVDEEVNNEENYPVAPKVSFAYRLTIEKADGSYENYSEQTMLSHYQEQNKNYSINFATEEEAQAAIDAYREEMMEQGDKIPEGGETVVFTLQPQIAMTVMDHTNGQVLAICGGRGDKTATKTLNRATNSTRQAGSTFKILAAYAPALDAAGLTLASVQDDAPMDYANGTPLHNYDNKYRGFTNLRQAITMSMNIVTVKTLTQIGTGLGFEYVQDFGISTLESGDNNQSLALGGITWGVKNVELCAAYATIANKGKYNRPVYYTKVLDHNGNVILDSTEYSSKEVLKETTAWLLTSAMQDVVTSGTGTRANPSNMTVAGKTGTTTGDRDVAFAGFSPYYTAAIWGGFDDHATQSNTAYANNIWREVMQRISEGQVNTNFPQPEGIVTASVCRKSGKLAIPGVCDADPRGSMVYTEFFAKGTEPTETCDHHIALNICGESGYLACPNCPNQISGVYIVGGSIDTEDGPYYADAERINQTCPLHDPSSNAIPVIDAAGNATYPPVVAQIQIALPTVPNPSNGILLPDGTWFQLQ
ncbi:MAG: PBP1A family penicillin-binding protein [Lachnospiraceae bacterium]|nr:PBP1A family penicillin-binding protein [Lachnospiraceae bacterium]